MESLDEEVLLEFKRFPAEKQEQVRGLVNYATLMGLTGKDLVSIGGKLDRIKVKQEITRNRAIVNGMDVRPVGKDKDCNRRWAWKSADGTLYHFTGGGWYDVVITNMSTKKSNRSSVPEHYPFGNFVLHRNRQLPNVMLNVYHGQVKLP